MALTDQLLFFLSSSISIIPTGIIIYFSLRQIYHLLDDKRLYFMLGLSLIGGVFIASFQTFTGNTVGLDLMLILVMALLFSLFDNLLKIILLNLKSYRGRRETVFYGICFSLMGSMVAALHGFRAGWMKDTNGLSASYKVAGFVILILAAVAFHSAMGIYNGYHSFRGRFWTLGHFSKVTLLSMPYYTILFYWYGTGFNDVLVLGIGTIYCCILLYQILKKYFPLALEKTPEAGMLSGVLWKKEKYKTPNILKRIKEIQDRER